MRLENQQLLYSATELANFLGCTHATALDRAVADGRLHREYRTDPTLDLLKELGERHEQSYLDHLRTTGKSVVELPKFGDPTGEETIAAMHSGADVIAQARLINLPPGNPGESNVVTGFDRARQDGSQYIRPAHGGYILLPAR